MNPHLIPFITATFVLSLAAAQAQSTSFTYQGRLTENGTPASGLHDFEFRLFTTTSGPVQVGSTLLANDLAVSNGLFTTSLDFGAAVFPGADRFLQIAVRPGVSTGAYTNLTPRQPITATPYAVRALEATTVASGAVTTTTLANQSVTGAKIADGTIGRDDVNIGSLGSAFWMLGGNSGTDVNTAHLGTMDNVPFSVLVNSRRALRLEPTPGAANFIGGHPANVVSNIAIGGFIGGGGDELWPNIVGANFATVIGGLGNTASGHSSVAGGNVSQASGASAVAIGGGAKATSLAATAFGSGTTASGAAATALGSGTVAGGFFSLAAGDSSTANGNFATAIGRRAKANHNGTFTWADSQNADFTSTAPDQFNIRAAGGVGIGTGNPQAPLHVYSGNNPTALRLQSAGGFGAARLEFFSDPQGSGAEWRPGYIQSTDNGGFTGGLSFHVNGTGFDQRLGDVEVMRLVNGRVGIGTANPIATLDVLGSISASGLLATDVYSGNLSSTGNFSLNHSSQEGTHTFTGPTRQMLNLDAPLFGTASGFGLQPYNLYFRSAGSFSWFTGGSHSDTAFDPGPGLFSSGTELMRLSGGYLMVNGSGNEQPYIGGDGAGGDIEIGSRNASILNAAFWNAAAGQRMNVFGNNFYGVGFNNISDRNAKENFKAVDAQSVLEKVAALALSEWNYKADTASRHIGPMAQDFHAAFGVGPDDKHIATVDADGVALAAIQGLNQKLEVENAALKARVEKLERLVESLANR